MIPIRFIPHILALGFLVSGIKYCGTYGSEGSESGLYGLGVISALVFFIWRLRAATLPKSPSVEPCEVHPSDEPLVTASDRAWWRDLRVADLRSVYSVEEQLRSAQAAMMARDPRVSASLGEQVLRQTFPTYYRVSQERVTPGDDAELPLLLKRRVSAFAKLAAANPTELRASSSFNAAVRLAIRSGRV